MPQVTFEPAASQPVANDRANAGDHVFALIIGIDKYESESNFRTLEGAVNDAEAFRKFLVDSREERGLGVPESNIRFLSGRRPIPGTRATTEERATRQGILDAFKSHLLDNPSIPNGGDAAMILFFAGHGTRVSAPGNLMSEDEKVEGICPVDERTGSGKEYVHTIPDYLLVNLLQQLSEKKGKNITAIFDSCHSGGLGRDVGQARAANSPAQLPPRDGIPGGVPANLDGDLFTNNGTDTSKGLRANSATHVWLAACGMNETAREASIAGKVRGRFTHSLIENLRQVDRENTTYAELIQRLESWDAQTPCCGGERRNLLLFASKYPSTGPSAMPVFIHQRFRVAIGSNGRIVVVDGNERLELVAQEVRPEEMILELDASANTKVVLSNEAHVAMPVAEITQRMFRVAMGWPAGVVVGTEFRVLNRDKHTVCTLVAHEVRLGSTILVLHPSANPEVVLPENARAVVSDWKNDKMILRVFVPPDLAHLEALFPAESQSNPSQRVFSQKSREDAHIGLRITEDAKNIVVNRFTDMFQCEPEACFPLQRDSALSNALSGVAHFNYFLEHRTPSAVSPLVGISMEVYRLEGNFPTRKPNERLGNLVVDNKVSLKSDATLYHGIIIRNTTAYELFPYLFAFDATEYTIHLLYEPHGTKAPLRSASGEVTVGMGGQRGLQFGSLPKDVKQSCTFLKLFVATKPIDISWIQQAKPFDPGFEGRPRFTTELESLPDTWDAFRITMTMTK